MITDYMNVFLLNFPASARKQLFTFVLIKHILCTYVSVQIFAGISVATLTWNKTNETYTTS